MQFAHYIQFRQQLEIIYLKLKNVFLIYDNKGSSFWYFATTIQLLAFKDQFKQPTILRKHHTHQKQNRTTSITKHHK
ncbi:MAG TPA: hypothetical protein DF637_03035 [Rikenellaceae bacterium]|nr:hypothetical protein [Rikenellaceae bacterium]